MGYQFLSSISTKHIDVRVACGEEERIPLTQFWSKHLGIDETEIHWTPKKQVSKRRAEHGVCKIRFCDTLLKHRISGWISWMRDEWMKR